MKTITIYQPWASLVAEGVKTIETRPRPYPWRTAIGETIAVHASMRPPDTFRLGDWWCEPTWGQEMGLLDEGGTPHRLPLGAVLATCKLVDVVPIVEARAYASRSVDPPCIYTDHLLSDRPSDAPRLLLSEKEFIGSRVIEEQRPYGDYRPGRWALILDRIEKLAVPIPARGKQGWWELPL